LVRGEEVRGGGSAERGGRRWTGLAAAAFRRAWAAARGSGSTSGR
jgi:hypothetical protein